MERLIWVCLGGAVGSGARYLMGHAVTRLAGSALPWGTLAVNLLGSFALTLILTWSDSGLSQHLKLALTTGVMGGFTTYSTFSYESVRYLDEGSPGLALANMALTLVLGLLASIGGLVLGRSL